MTVAPSQANEEAIRAAQQRMMQDPGLQHQLPLPKAAEPPNPPDWEWARWVVDVFNFLGPILKVVFWAGLALLVLGLAWFLVREILRTKFGIGRQKPVSLKDAEPEWRPDAQAARILLADADKLAAEGRFAEAAHLLLLRSIEDLDSRRPRTVRPALTARDIASLEALPEAARPAFGLIARLVERSLFGGAPVGADDYAGCRRAYEDFALPTGWGTA